LAKSAIAMPTATRMSTATASVVVPGECAGRVAIQPLVGAIDSFSAAAMEETTLAWNLLLEREYDWPTMESAASLQAHRSGTEDFRLNLALLESLRVRRDFIVDWKAVKTLAVSVRLLQVHVVKRPNPSVAVMGCCTAIHAKPYGQESTVSNTVFPAQRSSHCFH
jgi:hypothetical protein